MVEFSKVSPVLSTGIKLIGWRPDPVDTRDLSAAVLLAKVGKSSSSGDVDLRRFCSTVEDQRLTNSCVANAAVGALELLENSAGMPFQDLSRLFVYYNARLAIVETNKDEGSHIRHAMASLSAQGVCAESVWPFDVTKIVVRPSWKAYREGYVHRFNGYYRISGSGQGRLEQIEKALDAGHPVEFGVKVYENFMKGAAAVPMPMGSVVGRHAMLIVGYNRASRTLIIRNSWGTVWGDVGYGYIPYEFLDACDCQDVWVPTMIA